MKGRSHALAMLALAAATSLLASCAATSKDVDMTPHARITVDAHVGKGMTPDGKNIDNISKDFTTSETVYAVVDVPGRLESKDVKVRWVHGSDVVAEQEMTVQDGVNVYPFQLAPPSGGLQPGDYRFEVWIDGKEVEKEAFTVRSA